jgi:formiminotetrahydrofolate cyclodeaminase
MQAVDTEFLDTLASKAPVPGGGGASAYCGALAAALASMVGELTVGKKKFAAVEPQVKEALSRLEVLRSRLVGAIAADAEAFIPLSAAYGMPKDTPELAAAKNDALQAALVGACEIPLSIMRLCVDVLQECDFLAREGSRLAVSDAGVCAVFARAAVIGASLNVYINVSSIDDAARADAYKSQADELFTRGVAKADDIYNYVADAIGAPNVACNINTLPSQG